MNERSFILVDSFIESIMPENSATNMETTQQKIIRAAHDLFVQQGYHGTSMRQIAAQADIAL